MLFLSVGNILRRSVDLQMVIADVENVSRGLVEMQVMSGRNPRIREALRSVYSVALSVKAKEDPPTT